MAKARFFHAYTAAIYHQRIELLPYTAEAGELGALAFTRGTHMTQSQSWPPLVWSEWQDTADTLHMWTQIVGKVRLALSPMQQHWWNVPLYVTARGLGTSAMPIGSELLEIEFDFTHHHLNFRVSTGAEARMPLRPQTVSDFYRDFQAQLADLQLSVPIHPVPVEVKDPIPFAQDTTHRSYDADAAHRFWRVLIAADKVFQQFSSEYVGKISPVHFFWGSFDLAVSRYSGHPAPVREGADAIEKEAYSEEVISAGFWPGNGGFGQAAFYSYTVPAPSGLAQAIIEPEGARFNQALGEFILPYDTLRSAPDPEAALMRFLQSTYTAGANLAGWDRKQLERGDRQPTPRKPRSPSAT